MHIVQTNPRSRLMFTGDPTQSSAIEFDPDTDTSGPTSPKEAIRALGRECQAALGAGLHQLALRGVLVLIDTCGALGAENGRSTGGHFQGWLSKFADMDDDMTSRLWGLRCSVLHQGRALPDRHKIPIAFVEPKEGRSTIHLVETQVGDDIVLWLSLADLIDHIVLAVEHWLLKRGDQNPVKTHLAHVAFVHRAGLRPHAVGLPVIA